MTIREPDATRVKRWAVRVHTMLLDVSPDKKMGIVKAELAKLPLEEQGLAQQLFELGLDVAKASLAAESKKTRNWFAGGLTLLGALGSAGILTAWWGTAQRCTPGVVQECPAAVPSTQTCTADGRRFGECLPKLAASSVGGSGPGHAARDAGP